MVNPINHHLEKAYQVFEQLGLFAKRAELVKKPTLWGIIEHAFYELKLLFQRLVYADLRTPDRLLGHVKNLSLDLSENIDLEKIDRALHSIDFLPTADENSVELEKARERLIHLTRMKKFGEFEKLYESFQQRSLEEIKHEVCDLMSNEGMNRDRQVEINDPLLGKSIAVPTIMDVDIPRVSYMALNGQILFGNDPVILSYHLQPNEKTYQALLGAFKQNSNATKEQLAQELSWLGTLMSQAGILPTTVFFTQWAMKNLDSTSICNPPSISDFSGRYINISISSDSIHLNMAQVHKIADPSVLIAGKKNNANLKNEKGLDVAYIGFQRNIKLSRSELQNIIDSSKQGADLLQALQSMENMTVADTFTKPYLTGNEALNALNLDISQAIDRENSQED